MYYCSYDSDSSDDYAEDRLHYVNVWTDGACINNGKPNAKAGIGVYFEDRSYISMSVPGHHRPTNNVAEILAATHAAIEVYMDNDENIGATRLKIHTDSKFMIDCVVKYMKTWKNNGWRKTNGRPVVNKKELIELDEAIGHFEDPSHVEWIYVPAHSGVHGNEMADKLAKAACYEHRAGRRIRPDSPRIHCGIAIVTSN